MKSPFPKKSNGSMVSPETLRERGDEMLEVYPAYFNKFKCIAGDCKYSCCEGWEVDIDDESLKRYMDYKGPLSKRLHDSIRITDGHGSFIIRPNGRCPFLNDDNLCDIYAEMGEKALCRICTEHPRFSWEWGDIRLKGVGLSCEQCARLILDPDEDNSLVNEDRVIFDDEGITEIWKEFLNLRDHADALVSNWLNDPEVFNTGTLEAYIDFLMGLNLSSYDFALMLQNMKNELPEILKERAAYVQNFPECFEWYIRLTEYFLYRHFMTAGEFEDPQNGMFSELQFSMLSVSFIHLMNVYTWHRKGEFTLKDQIDNCKVYSRELEYCDDNTVALEDYIM